MSKDEYVLKMDEDTQGLVINSLLKKKQREKERGNETESVSEFIIEVCNAPKKKDNLRGKQYER